MKNVKSAKKMQMKEILESTGSVIFVDQVQ